MEPDRTLSVTQRENVMKELISKSFIEKQSKTCKVKHTYQTVGAANVHELNKKIRSVNVKGAKVSEALPELKQSAAKLEQLIESNKDRLNVQALDITHGSMASRQAEAVYSTAVNSLNSSKEKIL